MISDFDFRLYFGCLLDNDKFWERALLPSATVESVLSASSSLANDALKVKKDANYRWSLAAKCPRISDGILMADCWRIAGHFSGLAVQVFVKKFAWNRKVRLLPYDTIIRQQLYWSEGYFSKLLSSTIYNLPQPAVQFTNETTFTFTCSASVDC